MSVAAQRAADLAEQHRQLDPARLKTVQCSAEEVAVFLAYIGRMSIYPRTLLPASKLDDLLDGLLHGQSLRELVPALGLPGSVEDDDF